MKSVNFEPMQTTGVDEGILKVGWGSSGNFLQKKRGGGGGGGKPHTWGNLYTK